MCAMFLILLFKYSGFNKHLDARYFIVSYQGVSSDNNLNIGSITTVINDGDFINQDYTLNWIKENNNLESVTITHILEITSSDYEQFITNQ